MTEIKRIVLARYCDGAPKPDDFALDVQPMAEPREGQFRIRHVWNSVDPGTRSRLSGFDSYIPALPLGKPVGGFSVGVVEASNHDQYKDGDTVFFDGGWRTHSMHTGKGFIGKVPETPLPLSYWVGVLGVPGLTSWFGLKKTARFKEGDRVLVTSAAGPVGATAGQLAKAWGAEKVVGIAGADEKCAWLKDEAGFDEAINYKTAGDLDAAIGEAFPKGVDVLFDNVGNVMINRVLPKMRMFGRVCVSGQVADYSLPADQRPGIQNTDVFITHRINMQGLVVFDFIKEFQEALTEMAGMIGTGKIMVKEERFEGIEAMPEAFCGLFTGESFGRRVVKVGAES